MTKIADKILELCTSENLVDTLSEQQLRIIGEDVVSNTLIDDQSRIEWLSVNQLALEIAKQTIKKKSIPFENASNVMYPLITEAAYSFASREYPQLVRGDRVIEVAVVGKDETGKKDQLATRISKDMNYQILLESDIWQYQTDKLLNVLGVVGTVFRKVYWDEYENKPCFDLCLPERIIVNSNISCLEHARRVTHVLSFYKNDIVERIRCGSWSEIDLDKLSITTDSNYNFIVNKQSDNNDTDPYFDFFEQHTFLDLDQDGYSEPYIVTVEVSSKQVVSIRPRFLLEDVHFSSDGERITYIKPFNYFVDFHLFPNPDGSFYSLGYGTLLYPLNKAINTGVNQLIDAGKFANMQGGLITSNCRIQGGDVEIAPGRFQKVEGVGTRKLEESLMLWPFKEPSQVLQSLVELLIRAGKEIGSITEILSGEQPTQNSPATSVLSLIRQGLTKPNAIHKRVLHAFTKEFQLLYKLNCEYLDKTLYLERIADSNASMDDYSDSNLSIKTVAEPNMSSDEVRIYRAQSILNLPIVNPIAAVRNYMETLDYPEALINQLVPQQLPPNPEAQLKQAEAQLKMQEAQSIKIDHIKDVVTLENESKRLEIERIKTAGDLEIKKADVRLKDAQAIFNYAQAEALPVKLQIDGFKHALNQLEEGKSLSMEGASKAIDKFDVMGKNNDNQQSSSGIMDQGSSNPENIPTSE